VFGWPDHACRGCSFVADQVAHVAHLNARDTTLAFASRAPQAEIERLKTRMGWTMPWYTITDSFDTDFGVDEWHGTNAFIRDDDNNVFRTYFVNNRGGEQMGSTWNYLDITAFGRQQEWEDSPEGYPQTPPYKWWNWHDEYDHAPSSQWAKVVEKGSCDRVATRSTEETMKIVRRITHGVLIGGFVAELGALAIADTHTLRPTPKTVTWGYFDANTPPVLRVNSGDTVEIEALVAAAPRQLEAAGVSREKIQQALIDIDREVTERGEIPHILTGPIYVEGAKPGDVLEVRILSVDLTIPYAVTFFMPGRGFLPDEFPYFHARSIPLDMNRKIADFAPGIEVPIRPFFGVIGVAPPPLSGRISSGPPWIHTGNMDNKELIAGSTLYVPVHADGALFSVGDGHAAQGDGEVCVTAMETSLRGTFQLIVRKDLKLDWPRAETPTDYMTMGFHENLTEATRIATEQMLEFLMKDKHLDRSSAYVLASNAMNLRITQLVDGKVGVHALVPKAIFKR
jgi:acetamidase/formamidase